MKEQIITNKQRTGLYNIALMRIEQCERNKGEIISFPKIFESLCRLFSIKKKEAWEIIFILRDFGFIEIVRFHGIKILRDEE